MRTGSSVWLECRPVTPEVAGSSPVRSASYYGYYCCNTFINHLFVNYRNYFCSSVTYSSCCI